MELPFCKRSMFEVLKFEMLIRNVKQAVVYNNMELKGEVQVTDLSLAPSTV